MLKYHPDKLKESDGVKVDRDIRLVNEARWVLSDPGRRKEWEEAFQRGKMGLFQADRRINDFVAGQAISHEIFKTPHITQHISLSLFTPHFTERDEETPSYYTHPCRCSGVFLITPDDLEAGVDLVGCNGCGEWAGVGYEVVEDDALK